MDDHSSAYQPDNSHLEYEFGEERISRIYGSKSLVVGLGPIGSEVLRNLLQYSVRWIYVYDPQPISKMDIKSCASIHPDEEGHNRAEAALKRIEGIPQVEVVPNVDGWDELVGKVEYVFACGLDDKLSNDLNKACRARSPQAAYFKADMQGFSCSLFVDLGDEFKIADRLGRELPQPVVHLSVVSTDGTVICTEDHGLRDGDSIRFWRLKGGMSELNGSERVVKVISSKELWVDGVANFGEYQDGGIIEVAAAPDIVRHESFQVQLKKPSFQYCSGIPNVKSSTNFVKMRSPPSEPDAPRWTDPHMATLIAGFTVSEFLKAASKTGQPLTQWLVLPNVGVPSLPMKPWSLLVVGCSSIALEVLRILAVTDGLRLQKVIMIDSEVVRRCNVAGQSLLNQRDVGRLKCEAIADRLRDLNPRLETACHCIQFRPDIHPTLESKEFWAQYDVVLSTVDDLTARRAISRSCMESMKPVLHCGTRGLAGCIEIIHPHWTEAYQDSLDPPLGEGDYPYCTIKSFPSEPGHLIEWASAKKENLLYVKPKKFNWFWNHFHFELMKALEEQSGGESAGKAVLRGEGSREAVKMLPHTKHIWDWDECIVRARRAFHQYFDTRARQLLHCFPADWTLADGSLFWTPPKHLPTPVKFNPKDDLHMDFIMCYAALWAKLSGIPNSCLNRSREYVTKVLQSVTLPEFVPIDGKTIEIDENAKKPAAEAEPSDSSISSMLEQFASLFPLSSTTKKIPCLYPIPPKRLNHSGFDHVDHFSFIESAANLRADMYGLDRIDMSEIKRIAGRIVPTVGCTASIVGALACVEIPTCLSVDRKPFITPNSMIPSDPTYSPNNTSPFHNWTFDMTFPSSLSTYGPSLPSTTCLSATTAVTCWDRWEVKGDPVSSFTLQNFIEVLREKYGVEVTMVVQDTKMVYVPIVPGHPKRKKMLMSSLVNAEAGKCQVVLTVTVQSPLSDDEDLTAPPVYYTWTDPKLLK